MVECLRKIFLDIYTTERRKLKLVEKILFLKDLQQVYTTPSTYESSFTF